MARLFFALWPDRVARTALAARAAEIARRSGGRPVPPANLHLTLVFLGEVDASRFAALKDAAGGPLGRAFDVELDVAGGFRGARVAWAGCRNPPRAMLAMQATLEESVRKAGFAPDGRPFAPHLTLARRVRESVEVRAMEPVAWRADAFALVESRKGDGGYCTVAEWKLGEEEN